VVGRPARRRGAGIGVGGEIVLKDWEHPGGGKEGPLDQALLLDDLKIIPAEPSGGGGALRNSHLPGEAVSAASDRTVFSLLQVATWDLNSRFDPELVIVLERLTEVQALGMSEEPGGVMVFIAFDGGDSQGDLERPTMLAE
jgi:hypothetical protein